MGNNNNNSLWNLLRFGKYAIIDTYDTVGMWQRLVTEQGEDSW